MELEGPEDQYVKNYFNIQKREIRLPLGLNAAKNTYFTKKATDKSSLGSNFGQKSPRAHKSISPSSGANINVQFIIIIDFKNS